MSEDKAAQIVVAILTDLTDRSGLQNEWDAIDADVQQEIKEKWTALIRQILDGTSETQGWEPHQTPMSVSPDWKADGTGFRE